MKMTINRSSRGILRKSKRTVMANEKQTFSYDTVLRNSPYQFFPWNFEVLCLEQFLSVLEGRGRKTGPSLFDCNNCGVACCWTYAFDEERSKGHTDESSKFQVLRQRRSLAWSQWRLRPEISAKHFSENKKNIQNITPDKSNDNDDDDAGDDDNDNNKSIGVGYWVLRFFTLRCLV